MARFGSCLRTHVFTLSRGDENAEARSDSSTSSSSLLRGRQHHQCPSDSPAALSVLPINFKSALCSFLPSFLPSSTLRYSLVRAGPMLCPRTPKCFVLPLILILVFFFSEELYSVDTVYLPGQVRCCSVQRCHTALSSLPLKGRNERT